MTFLSILINGDTIQIMNEQNSFRYLFKKFRIKSGFYSLSDFGNALAESGLIFEDSIFSHWQRGARIPTQRSIIIHIIRFFYNHRGIVSINEANLFAESSGHGYLTHDELLKIFPSEILPINYDLDIDENPYRDEHNNMQDKFEIIEHQVNLLYEKIYEGYPEISLNLLQRLKKILMEREMNGDKRRIDLISKINWISIRCFSDISKPGGFQWAFNMANKYLSYAKENNSSHVGSVFWTASAILRLKIITNPIKIQKKKELTLLSLAMSQQAIKNTPNSRIDERIVQYIEIAKIALILNNRELFLQSCFQAEELATQLSSRTLYINALVWDIKARGTLHFEKNSEKALLQSKEAKKFSSEKFQAINLYLGNTELHVLRNSEDNEMIKYAEVYKKKFFLFARLLNNPYQKMRAKSLKYSGF